MVILQYDIFNVDLNPTVGSEINKTRPCLVISPNEINNNLNTVIIAPLTSSNKKYPTRIRLTHKNREGYIALDQIRTIDKSRLINKQGAINPSTVQKVKLIIKETFVD
ncbi:MAG: type II toxin-antitoxin system PemK/MazF family toxin [Candidatus Kapaibacteriales bacterium]